jgi:DNA invertase Pin-like site-specific DNA recombinase
VEPNSGLGQAISYLLKHWEKLTLFLRQAGVPLDNNIVERALKKAILHRKNSLFYKTRNGAGMGDLFMSLIHTCELNGVNAFDYLTELQRHAGEVKRDPASGCPGTTARRWRGSIPGRMEDPPPGRKGSSSARRTGHPEMAGKRASENAKSGRVFGQARKQPKMFRAGIYARVSTIDQQTIPLQMRALRDYAARRGWTVVLQVREIGSGASARELRERIVEAARRRQIDVVLVWRLDRWGRSVTDLLATLQDLEHLGVGFVSLTEALDLTTPAGRAMAALLAVFAEFEREILRERVRAGLAHARHNGKRLGRPPTAAVHISEVRRLFGGGVSKAEIARRLQIGRTSVRRILAEDAPG